MGAIEKIRAALEELSEETRILQTEAATAWDKCEQRRLEAVRATEALSSIKQDLLCNDPRKLGSILRKIDAVLEAPLQSEKQFVADLLADMELMREAIEYAHAQGFEWPSDPMPKRAARA